MTWTELQERLKKECSYYAVAQIGINPVSGMNQYGPCCGIYALRHVMAYWGFGCPDLVPHLRARNNELGWKDNKPRPGPHTDVPGPSMRKVAKSMGLTLVGELWSADNMAELARCVCMQADVLQFNSKDHKSFEQVVKTQIVENCPLLFAFDVVSPGGPGAFGGEHAHWTTICGFGVHKTGQMSVVHFHWGMYHFHSAALLCLSNSQLKQFAKDTKWYGKDPGGHDWNNMTEGFKETKNQYQNHDLLQETRSRNLKHDPKQFMPIREFHQVDLGGLRGQLVRVTPRDYDKPASASDTEFIRLLQEVVREYEASLNKLFRRASAQSKHVIAMIKKYLDHFAHKTDLLFLKALVRYHLGMTNQGVPEFGERLKHDSTLWKILHNKFAKKNITM